MAAGYNDMETDARQTSGGVARADKRIFATVERQISSASQVFERSLGRPAFASLSPVAVAFEYEDLCAFVDVGVGVLIAAASLASRRVELEHLQTHIGPKLLLPFLSQLVSTSPRRTESQDDADLTLSSHQVSSVLPALNPTELIAVCKCQLQQQGIPLPQLRQPPVVPAVASLACRSQYERTITDDFTYASYFCGYMTTLCACPLLFAALGDQQRRTAQ
ncbi:hypothetical protein ANO11243_097580 [Dothideomycetidae sp. 11243]|nr:hypothetical protein ANO11243_097580 [fungal sp. No.11243]